MLKIISKNLLNTIFVLKIISLLLLVLSFINVKSQDTIKSTGLLEDFCYLYNSLKDNSISMNVYCKHNHINDANIYDSLYSVLAQNPTLNNFYKLSTHLFNISGDWHNQFASINHFNSVFYYLSKKQQQNIIKQVDTSNFSITNQYLKAYYTYYNKMYNNNYQNIKIKYFNGNYYFTRDTYFDKKKIAEKNMLLSINNIPINKFINDNYLYYFLKYDSLNSTYYTENNIFSEINYICNTKDSIAIAINNNKNDTINIKITSNTEIKFKNKTLITRKINSYILRNKIVYIKIISFSDLTKLIKKLNKNLNNKEIDYVIFDIRDNRGGSDLEWIRLLSLFEDSLRISTIPKQLYYNTPNNIALINNYQLINDYICFENDILTYIDTNNKIINNSITKYFCIFNNNTFSSALSFASLNQYIHNFITIGVPSPYIGGIAATPSYFMLPNTKLIYKINCTFDYNMLLNNSYRVIPNFIYQEPINEIINFENKVFKNYNSKKYLIRKNHYYTIIEHIINQ